MLRILRIIHAYISALLWDILGPPLDWKENEHDDQA